MMGAVCHREFLHALKEQKFLMDGQKQNKKKSPLVVTIAAVLGAVIGSAVVHQYFNQPPRIDSALVNAAAEINKHLPMMIDKETRLDATMAVPNKTIIYRYTLVDRSASDLQKDTLIKAVRPTLVANYRTNESMKTFRVYGSYNEVSIF